jgi:hypothetical protein
MMQEENLNSSIDLATKIQDNFTNNLERKSRGVKQQPLWVLDAAYMPSVLIELGFLSNKEEGEFLNSDEGQNKMARQIAEAIIKYKKEYFNEAYTTNENVKYLDLPAVKEVAEPISTIRHWTKLGLLEVAELTVGGFALYDFDMVSRCKEIQDLKKKRFTLAEIKHNVTKL